MADENLKYVFTVDEKGLVKGIENSAKAFKKLDSSSINSTNSLGKMNDSLDRTARKASSAGNLMKKAFIGIGAYFGARMVYDFAKSSISIASNLAEVQNVVDVTFGSMSSRINEFALSAAQGYGLSELSAKKYTGTMGAMLKSMGLGTSKATDMSIEMAKLAGDFASFYNLDSEEAFSKIRSGISGETEPLKQLGINMSVANLEAYALSQGITTGYASMNQQNQSLTRMNYLLSVSKDAQGDFSRTSSSWANQTRILSLQFDSFKANLGSAFIAVLTPVLQGLNSLMATLITATAQVKSFFEALGGSKKSSDIGKTVATSTDQASAGLDGMAASADSANKAMNSLAGFDKLNVLTQDTSTTSTSGSDTSTSTTGQAASAIDNVKNSFSGLKAFLDENSAGILAVVSGLVTGIAGVFLVVQWPTITAAVTSAFALMGTAIAAISWPLVAIGAAIGLVVAALVYLWNTNDGFKTAVIGAWDNIVSMLSTYWNNFLAPIFDAFMLMMVNVWDNGVKPLWDGFVGFINQIVLLAADLLLAFKPVFDWFVTTFGPIMVTVWQIVFGQIGNIINTAMGVFKIFFNYLSGAIASIRTIFSGIVEFVSGVFSGDWKKAWDGIKTIFTGIWDGIKNYLTSVINVIISGINFLIKQALVPINSLIKGWNNTVGKVTGKITEIEVVIPSIKQFADGGIAFGPTLGMFAEYANARSNPEVVAPLDRLKSMIGSNSDSEQIALLREQNQLLRDLYNKDNSTYLDGEAISKNQNERSKREARIKGYALVG
jgi:hypothetical protein